MKEKQSDSLVYEYWFAGIRALSTRKKRKLREELGNAENIYYIEETKLRSFDFLTEKDIMAINSERKNKEIKKEYDICLEKGIVFVPFFHPQYPRRLRKIVSPPYALYVKGNLPDDDKPSAAIVGARQCTPYGEQMAISFAEMLAENGVQIISGMAKGIDGAGQRGALNVGGKSYGVLGCGIDICYPREHIGLYSDLQKSGGILSEQPTGTPPLKEFFPARNRIISGLSDIVLVMEAKEKSGSLITADMALEQGKDVYALPGPITSNYSRGCNELIRQGAGILVSPEELMEELGVSCNSFPVKMDGNSGKNEKMLERAENLVYSKLDLYPKSLSRLLDETKMAPAELMQQLTSLIIKGYIEEISKNYYVRSKL